MTIFYSKFKIYCRLLMALLVTCGIGEAAYAQGALTVSGRVTDAKGETLPGVSVVLKGTQVSTSTNAEGSYSITAPNSNGTLVFAFIGMASQEVSINGRSTVNVSLSESSQALEEVVVVGYGERRRKEITGAISSMGASEIAQSPFQSPELAMQGRMPGVFVSTPGGDPTARPTVRIRGVSTFGNAEPLYVVDGVPLYEAFNGANEGAEADLRTPINVMNTINPNDIESISVLKDATASAIYGVRASNGVILITTKRGKAGKPKVEFSSQTGISNITKKVSVLNVQDFVTIHQEQFANSVNPGNLPTVFNPASSKYLGNMPTVDWQTPLINKNAAINDYSLRILGGTENTSFYVGGGYNRTESSLIENEAKRYTLSTNVNSKVNKYLSAGVNFKLSYLNSRNNTLGDLNDAANYAPWQPIYGNGPNGFAPSVSQTFKANVYSAADSVAGSIPMGKKVGDSKYNAGLLSPEVPFLIDKQEFLWGPETNSNVFGRQSMQENTYGVLRNLGTAFVQVEPIVGLKFRGSLGMDWTQNRRNTFIGRDDNIFLSTPANPYSLGLNGLSRGTAGRRYNRGMNTNLETSINYTKSFSKHNFDVLVNASTQRFKNDFEDMSYSNLEKVDALRRNNITNQAPYTKAFAFFDRSAVQGYLGRLNYNFDNKYYLDATVRRDGSSKFDKDYRWGTFPAVSGAWRISSEKFMSDLTFINDLKIRGGWGQLGNQETAAYKFLSTVNGGSDYAFGSGTGTTGSSGVPISGSTLLDFPVIDLSWETAETSNYGFDGTFFNNRLTFSAEYYTRLVKGILQSAGLAASIGNQVSPVLNIANVGNRGVELQTSYSGKVGEFGYNVGGNITTVRNRVLKVYQSNPFGGEVNSSRADQLRIEVGHPLFSYWGYEVGGIFQNQAEIDEWRKTNSDGINGNKFAPGDMWFKDVARAPLAGEGNQPIQEQDGKIDVNDRKILGKSIAGYYYGFNFGANWKNFDLSTFFQGVGDVQRYNAIRQQGEQMSSNGVNQWTTTLNRWTPQNPSTTIPRAVNGDPAQNNRPSSRFLENSSYLRLKNVQLGYNLPSNLKKRLGFVDNLRIYAAGINLFTATQWTGLDPENDNVPPTRSFMFGLNANF